MIKSNMAIVVVVTGAALFGAACGAPSAQSPSTQDASPAPEPESLAGTWQISFEWAGRTPGELTLVVAGDQTCQQLSGPGVGATTGTASVTGDDATWVLEDGSTWSGVVMSSASISGTMKSAAGNVGTFNGTKE